MKTCVLCEKEALGWIEGGDGERVHFCPKHETIVRCATEQRSGLDHLIEGNEPDIELLPCPFCGVVPEPPKADDSSDEFHSIWCRNINCDAIAGAEKMGRAKVARAWNKRHNPAATLMTSSGVDVEVK